MLSIKELNLKPFILRDVFKITMSKSIDKTNFNKASGQFHTLQGQV